MSYLLVRYKRYVLVCIAALFSIMLIASCRVAASGVFDFSDQLQTKDFYTNLDGEWHFFEEKLLTPDEVKSQRGKSLHSQVHFKPIWEIPIHLGHIVQQLKFLKNMWGKR